MLYNKAVSPLKDTWGIDGGQFDPALFRGQFILGVEIYHILNDYKPSWTNWKLHYKGDLYRSFNKFLSVSKTLELIGK